MHLSLGLYLGGGSGVVNVTPPYDPNSEAGSDLVWFDTQDTASYTVASTRVTQFTNKASGQSYPAVGTTANQASALTGGGYATGLNGFPACTPDGNDNYAFAETAVLNHLIVNANNPYTLYGVYIPSGGAIDNILFSVANNASASQYKAWGQGASGQLVCYANDGAGKTASSSTAVITAGKPIRFTLAFDGTTARFYQDGALVGTVSHSVAALASANLVSLFYRGRSANDLDLVGTFGELRVRNAYHDPAAVLRMHSYLDTKWQLSWPSVSFIGDSLVRRHPLEETDITQVMSDWIKPYLAKGSVMQSWNLAVDGNEVAAGINGGTQTAWRTAHGRPWSTANTWAFIAAGTNDLCVNTLTSAQVIAALAAAVTSCHSVGIGKVIVDTLHERVAGQLCGSGADFETERLAVNAAILGGSTGADFTTDGGAALKTARQALGLSPGVANALYVDAVHLTALGYSYKYAPAVALLNAQL